MESYINQIKDLRERMVQDANNLYNEYKPIVDAYYSGEVTIEQRKEIAPKMSAAQKKLSKYETAINHLQDALYEMTGGELCYDRFTIWWF